MSTTESKVRTATVALRDAKIEAIKESEAAMRAEFGECPREYDHFDFGSFICGVVAAGAFLAFMKAFV